MATVTIRAGFFRGTYPNSKYAGRAEIVLTDAKLTRTTGNKRGGRQTDRVVGTCQSVTVIDGDCTGLLPKVGDRVIKCSFDVVGERPDVEHKTSGYTKAAETFAKMSRENGLDVSDYLDHSRVSESKYLVVNGHKVRFSAHPLPSHYEQPSLDIRCQSPGQLKCRLDELLQIIEQESTLEDEAAVAFAMYDAAVS